jgi:hypothetical protein
MKLIFIHVLLFLFLLSCKKDYIPVKIDCALRSDIDSIKKDLSGTWVWLQEYRFNQRDRKFEYLTPKTEGYSLTLKFDGNRASYFKNNKPDSVYNYDVEMLSSITGFVEDSIPILVLYTVNTGLRNSYVPVQSCPTFLLTKSQFVSSVLGEFVWKKQ